MSTPMGFRYLHDAGYIDREMDMWFNVSKDLLPYSPVAHLLQERNIYYVIQVEVFLAKVFNSGILSEDDQDLLYVSKLLVNMKRTYIRQCIRRDGATPLLWRDVQDGAGMPDFTRKGTLHRILPVY